MPFDAAALTAASASFCAPASRRLADAALSLVHVKFERWEHRLSDAQWAAIRHLLDHMERAAEGSLPPAVYVSPIPAGTGKSVSIQAFAEALVSSPTHSQVGMLIACNRIEEVKDMATALEAHRDKLHVIAGRENSLGRELGDHPEADTAQVLVCTQAALKQTLRTTPSFDNAGRFHYRGARRPVVCWDEAISFNRPAVVEADAVGGLARALRSQSNDAANAILEWAAALAKAPHGQCAVPDFEALGVVVSVNVVENGWCG